MPESENESENGRPSWSVHLRQLIRRFGWTAPTLIAVGRFSFAWRNFQMDDSLIYLRYVRNFREGSGLVFNPGTKFNGLTSPLFAYLMVGASFLSTNYQAIMIVVGAVCFAATALVFGRCFGDSKAEAGFISFAIAVVGYFYWTFGMETPLFLLALGAALLLRRRGSDYFIVALAVVVGARAEGIFLAVPMLAEYLIAQRSLPSRRSMVLAATVGLLPVAINLLYYGELLPSTAGAKFGQGRSGYWGVDDAFFQVDYLRVAFISGSRKAIAIVALLAIVGVLACYKDRVAQSFVLFCIVVFGFYAHMNMPNYHWYYAPLILAAVVFAAKGAWFVCRWAISGLAARRSWWKPIIALPVCGAVGFVGVQVVSFDGAVRNESYAVVGEWLRDNTPPDTTIAAVEIGTIGWYSERPLVDILGLVNEHNADFIADRNLYGWMTKYQPDMILRHEPTWNFESVSDVLESSGAYAPVAGFDVPGFVLIEKTDLFSDAEIVELVRRAGAPSTTG